MTTRYRPLSDRYDRGARPVQGPGAGLYSAGRGFAPPGSTKPADAVFALRVTIPGAFARSRSLRATLADAGFETAPGSRAWLGRFAPFARPLSDPPSRASRRGASHRRRSCFRRPYSANPRSRPPREPLGACAPSPLARDLSPVSTGSNSGDGSPFLERLSPFLAQSFALSSAQNGSPPDSVPAACAATLTAFRPGSSPLSRNAFRLRSPISIPRSFSTSCI